MGNAPKRKTATKKRPVSQTAATTRPQREFPWRQIGVGAGIVAALALAIFIGTGGGGTANAGVPEGTEFVTVESGVHVEGEIPHPPGDNPVGGPHNSIWLNCGIYDEPVPSENAVHSLEHAAVWVTYQGLTDADVETLRDVASRRQKMIVSPEPEQAAPLRLTAWGAFLEVDAVDDPRVVQFINEFEGSPDYAPEPGAVCVSGIGSPIG